MRNFFLWESFWESKMIKFSRKKDEQERWRSFEEDDEVFYMKDKSWLIVLRMLKIFEESVRV